jgi:hypothetical protein
MANALYDKGREHFLKGDIVIATDNIKVALVRTGVGHYVVNLASDEFLGVAIAAGDIISRTANLGTKTTTAGVFGAANTVFSAVAAGAACGAIVIYDDSGVDNTSKLIAYIDGYAGLPVTPNGSDINVTWPSSGNGSIFKL